MTTLRYLLGLAMVCLLVSPTLEARQQASTLSRMLSSSSALVIDLRTNQILFAKNPNQRRPIASVTKLMTAMVVLDSGLPMWKRIPVVIRSNPDLHGVYSRVRIGSMVTRRDMLHMALMSSENRAANSLAENYPGGMKAFVAAMNAKARKLGMTHTHYVEPTGLSPFNQSTASDLMKLLKATSHYPLIAQLSHTPTWQATFTRPVYSLPFYNTNRLTRTPRGNWNIEVTKTGFTNAAGHCLVMRTHMAGRLVGYVSLHTTAGKQSHIADASRVRHWLESGSAYTPVSSRLHSHEPHRIHQVLEIRRSSTQ